MDHRKSFDMKKRKILFIGNPGVGKSTLLNCLMKAKNPQLSPNQLFKSGVSINTGLTFQLDIREIGDEIFFDTPGLQDVEKRKQAAQEITKALQQDGRYLIVFVVTLESGRMRPEDLTVIKLVLESAKDINFYGVIFNKIGKNLHKEIEKPENKMKYLAEVSLERENGMENSDRLINPLFLRKIKDLDDENDVTASIPELEEFIREIPEVIIKKEAVTEIRIDFYEKLKEELEKQISELSKDNEELQRNISNMQKDYEEKLENLKANQQKKHEAAMKRLEENNQRMHEDFKKKEAQHLEEMERFREENKEWNEEQLQRMEQERKKEFEMLRQNHEQIMEKEKEHRKELMENNQRIVQSLPKRGGGGGLDGFFGGLLNAIGYTTSVLTGVGEISGLIKKL